MCLSMDTTYKSEDMSSFVFITSEALAFLLENRYTVAALLFYIVIGNGGFYTIFY